MIRRPPTRLELKLDDIGEYEQLKKEAEARRARDRRANAFASSGGGGAATGESPGDATGQDGEASSGGGKTRSEMVHERIGFDPASRKPT